MCTYFQGLYNRWIVSLNMVEAAECLVCGGFYLYNRHIVIRLYYDVLMEEYEEYQEYLNHRDYVTCARERTTTH